MSPQYATSLLMLPTIPSTQMKSNVENMETEMERLTKNVERISHNSSAINETFGEKRTKIHQLSGVHNLLKKVMSKSQRRSVITFRLNAPGNEF
jgi:SMC interacting uncharacterized protein involved in chromosome segregation